MTGGDVDLGAVRWELATACRVLALRGLVDDVLGHVSQRLPDGNVAVRCRGPNERGLRFTQPADIRVVTLGGELVDDGPAGWAPPSELPIHTGVLAARPEVGAVVHAHPRSVVTLTLAGLALQPIVGAFDIPAARMAAAGIPIHPRSVLIRRADLADEMVASLGSAEACLLHGHGLVTVGATVAEAVLAALRVDSLARLTLDVHRVGGRPQPIPDTDRAELPDLGSGFNTDLLWRHHLACLHAEGMALPDPGSPPPPEQARS